MSKLTPVYYARIRNGASAADLTSSARVGGASLDQNIYNLPTEVLPAVYRMCCHDDNNRMSVNVWLEVFLELSLEQMLSHEGLAKYFMDNYRADIPHRFKGSNPLDQRPAVRSTELFPSLCQLLSSVWDEACFEILQEGSSPILKAEVTATGDLADALLDLIGFPE
jgi:hypothetical protein